jgi:vesicle coat complex subunit
LPSDYLANEEYNLYKELYEDRVILEILPEETGNIIDHLMTIASITQDRDQLFNRLANDIFLKNMLSVDYLKKSEVEELINHFNIEYKHKEFSNDEKALLQLLNEKTPDDLEGRLESLLENLKDLDLSLFEKCGIVIEGELSTDHLMNACLLLGYSNADHLTSVKHMHGFRVVEINEVMNSDIGCLVLDNGDNVGLGCGVFAKV